MHKPSNLSDEALVKVIRLGDQEQYGQIVKRYEDKLWRYVATILADESMVADCVQETFIKAYVNLQGFDTKRKFSSWIYRIAHNQAINAIKKQRRLVSGDEVVEKSIHDNSSLEEAMDKQEVKLAMEQSVNQLPIKYREPLVLLFAEEKSYEEISDILRLPMGTVATRINRGKKLLRALYEKRHT